MKVLWQYITVAMVTTIIEIDIVSSVTMETDSLDVNGSPELGYFVELDLGTPRELVSIIRCYHQ